MFTFTHGSAAGEGTSSSSSTSEDYLPRRPMAGAPSTPTAVYPREKFIRISFKKYVMLRNGKWDN